MIETFEYKTWSKYYQQVKQGLKNFEIRKDDRPTTPKTGDKVILIETHDGTKEETGERLEKRVSYVLSHIEFEGLSLGYIAIGLSDESQVISESNILTTYLEKRGNDVNYTQLTSDIVDRNELDTPSTAFLYHITDEFENIGDAPDGVYRVESDRVNYNTRLALLPGVFQRAE